MIQQESVSAVTAVPGNVQPLEMTTYPASATMLQYNTGSTNLQRPHIVIQNPAGMTGLQAQPTILQYPGGMAGVQPSPGVIQYSPEIPSVQVLPGDPQNPLNTVPGPTQTSSNLQWNMSFMSFPEFDPKKFISKEFRTLGGIQILIGLFHIVSAANPQLYWSSSALGITGYLVWGGLSFIISGSLSISAEKSANSCMVNASISMNIVSSIFSLAGIIIIIVDLCVYNAGLGSLMDCLKAITGGLLPFAFLEFIITCVVSHFGCQATCWTHFENMTVISPMVSGNTVNMTNGPVNTTSPASAINIPAQATVQPTVPSNASPENIRLDGANLAQK